VIDIVRVGGEISAWPNYECKLAYFGLIQAAKRYILNVVCACIKVCGTKRQILGAKSFDFAHHPELVEGLLFARI